MSARFVRRGLALALLLLAPAQLVAAQQERQPAGAPVRLNFVDARLIDVVRSLAAALGLNVVLSDVPDRRVTFTTSAPIRADEVGQVLESILESNGLVLVVNGPIAQVMPAASAPVAGQVRVGTEIVGPVPLGRVTQLVPLQGIRAEEGAAALTQLAAATARIESVPRSNALLITDRGSNVVRYLELLRQLDAKPQGEAGLQTFVVPLKYANADDLAAALGQVFGVGVGVSRAVSLADRSLGRNLDVFRERETDAFRLRRDVPLAEPSTIAPGARDSVAQPGALVGQTTIVASAPTNALIIRTAPPNFPLLRETIDALDSRPPQVLFEVTVAEIALGRGTEFGIDWSAAGVNPGSTTSARLGNPAGPDSSDAISDFVVRVVSLNGVNVRALLRAIATTSDVNVLSTPEILAVNNREARILVGSKVPFIASTRLGNDVAIDRTVQFQDVGTNLTIIPTINSDDYVSVQILQEVSSLTSITIPSALNAPVISTREASTRAVLRDGQTVVIAGLIGDSREVIESGIPLLGDIPLLGALFRRSSVTRNRTELAIFVTPFIVRSDADADVIRERVRSRFEQRAPGMLPAPKPPVRSP